MQWACAVLCHPWPVKQYHIFPHYLINGMIFKKVIENKMCFSIFCTPFVRNISHYKKNRPGYHKSTHVFMWSTRYLCQMLMKLNFLCIFSKHNQISKFIGILAVGSELFHVDAQLDRQTHVTKLLVVFRNFPNAPNKDILLSIALWRTAVGQYSKGMVNGCRNCRISRNPKTALGDIRLLPPWSWMILFL
jgi:hypothetical protein